jgi:dTDP-4-amino-4,6-dideoxygalactose transaminase
VTLTQWGRQGLALGLRALRIGEGDEVLAPAYHHGSEIEAIRQSGARCSFYAGDARLEPDEAELESLLGPQVRALHLTHFLGFPQDVSRWRRWCSERNLFLIEDAAQAWLGESQGQPLGSTGDLAMFCLYKSVGVADGAAIVGPTVNRSENRSPGGYDGPLKRGAMWAAQKRLLPANVVMREAEGFDMDAEFAVGDIDDTPSRATLRLLTRFDFVRVVERRQRNFRRLLESLGHLVPVPFDSLPEGCSPWLFPIAVADKAEMLERFRAAHIDAADFWSFPHPSLEVDRFAGIAARRASTIGLPVHQELTDRDLDHIAEAVMAAKPEAASGPVAPTG